MVVLLLVLGAAASGGLGAALAMLGIVALLTGLYALLFKRRSWVGIPHRKSAALVAGAGVVAAFVGAGIAGATAGPEQSADKSASIAAEQSATATPAVATEQSTPSAMQAPAAAKTPTATPTPTPTTAGEAAAAAGGGIPKPDSQQEARLLADIEAINPQFINRKTVSNARNQCSSVLGGSPESSLIRSTQVRFTGLGVEAVTESEAEQILAAIRANGFCRAS
ncbi:hypothetical protein [Arthrobacter sp. ISL-65]|uniref:hypothetical protein n=1 Tax=Arthrobacter sp. ISL-65 TaxID=2819112 RepID=UPI001BE5F9DB|nr:hypothetical protein [Arthrobacter sp. ISL-65]MBT2549798.1 hypothetical protein [Arthrobacter sp. ISL-65]